MSAQAGDESPKFRVADHGGRPLIKPYSLVSKFRAGDKVYFRAPGSDTREGPFTVGPGPEAGKYTLFDKNDKQVKEGQEIKERDLEAA